MVKLKNIVLALSMCFVLSGLAAAEYPDAGNTWSNAEPFSLESNSQYTFMSGQLTQNNPVDQDDWWVNNLNWQAQTGDWLELYLDSISWNEYVRASLYDNSGKEMQRVFKNGILSNSDYTLDSAPFRVHIHGDLGTHSYEYGIYKA